jgi:hypothetical protein
LVVALEAYVFRTVFEPRTLLLGFSALAVQTTASEAKPLRARTHLVETGDKISALDEGNLVRTIHRHTSGTREQKGHPPPSTGPYLGLPLSFVVLLQATLQERTFEFLTMAVRKFTPHFPANTWYLQIASFNLQNRKIMYNVKK